MSSIENEISACAVCSHDRGIPPYLLLSVPQPYSMFRCWVNIYITVCVCPHYIFLCVLDTACCIVLINVAGKYVPLV